MSHDQNPYDQPSYDPYHDPTQLRPGAGYGAGQPGQYGQTPHGQTPYGQQIPYGQAPYGAPQPGPYGRPPIPGVYPRDADGTPISPWGRTASYRKRAIAVLWDMLLQLPGMTIYLIGTILYFYATVNLSFSESSVDFSLFGIALLLWLVGAIFLFVVAVVNWYVRQGRTGASWGKEKQGIVLIKESTGQPVGGGMAFVRYLLRGVICYAFYLDYLWPLWDPKRQALSDKVLGFVVVEGPPHER